MTKKMLVDATHAEEVRVAVVDGNQLVEFDYESKVRKQIKGGVYLAKVTRVEPSLQAAFVNYGGNRHGFLPFSEIHPDYFRIPVSDREALMAEQQAELEKLDAIQSDDEDDIIDVDVEDEVEKGVSEVEIDDDEDDDEAVVEVGGADKPADDEDTDLKKKAAKKSAKKASKKAAKKATKKSAKKAAKKTDDDAVGNVKQDDEKSDEELDAEALKKAQALESPEDPSDVDNNKRRGRRSSKKKAVTKLAARRRKKSDEIIDDGDNGKPFRFNLRHKYKIQEVVKRGQIMLIQVSKEERGNKGAAVTTYMSLPGRYCVLMPNSPRGGGVSRKIGNFKDRKRMRDILKELTIPEGMSVILRTAGVARTKAEIKRDLDYLTRLWNTIREETLKSSAPALINEEGNLIKRSIRDLYTRDIDEVLVAGAKGYKTAKDFMKMLVPSHAKKVVEYNDEKVPLFHRYHVEKQIAEIGEISVTLKSGGYLIINPTEALVSVDVNSGKATKERHIEGTALKTNLEAAEEVARQLRLRDLGGLVVIDFIDMEERRNNRKVENKLRDALSSDRARIQVGRISSFGLLELSRQRLNPSLTEAQFEKCPHCDGVGLVKTLDYAAISALRALEEEGIKGTSAELSLNLPNKVAVYILNNKRDMLATIEKRYDFRVHIRTDDKLQTSEFRVDVIQSRKGPTPDPSQNDNQNSNQQHQHNNNEDDGQDKPKKGRRRGRRGGRRNNRNRQNNEDQNQNSSQNNQGDDQANNQVKNSDGQNSDHKQDDSQKNDVKSKKPMKQPKNKFENDADNKTEKVKTKKPSNDVKQSPVDDGPKDYEIINEPPKKKKKGWWNKLID